MTEDRSQQYLKAVNPDNGTVYVGEKGTKEVDIPELAVGHYGAGAYQVAYDIDGEAKLSASASDKADVPEFDVVETTTTTTKPTTTTTTTKAPETTTTTTKAPETTTTTTAKPITTNSSLVLGTAKPFTMTGDGSENQVSKMYSLSEPVAKGTKVTAEFDVESTKAEGDCMVQFMGGSWQVISSAPLMAGTKHYSYIVTTDADYSEGIQLRMDKSTATVTVSNFTLSKDPETTTTTTEKA